MNIINNFKTKPYDFLSNFYPCEIRFEGLVYPSVENAFQAAKCLNTDDHNKFVNCSPAKAKQLGRKVDLVRNWDAKKLEIMMGLLRLKFEPNTYLSSMLLKTGTSKLVEENTWGDTFWGVCNGKGENHLGKLLMQRRRELALLTNELNTFL